MMTTEVREQPTWPKHDGDRVPPSTIADDDAQTAIDDGSVTEVCASHILVATEDEANAVIERIDGGEDFAAVAQEVSTDTGSGANGGDPGCTNPTNYAYWPEFADAILSGEIGQLTGPVETAFGFHVIRVDERNVEQLSNAPTTEKGFTTPTTVAPNTPTSVRRNLFVDAVNEELAVLGFGRMTVEEANLYVDWATKHHCEILYYSDFSWEDHADDFASEVSRRHDPREYAMYSHTLMRGVPIYCPDHIQHPTGHTLEPLPV